LMEGREDVQDDPRCGQPKTQRDRVWNLVRSDRRVGVRVIAEELNMNRETVRQIVKEDLGMKKIPQKWCLESWRMTRNNVGFTFHLIFYALQRCFIGLLPVMKRGVFNMTRNDNDRACTWKTQNSPRPEKRHTCLGQDHALCFFDHKRILHYEFISQGQTVNQQCYLEVLTRLRQCVRGRRPGLWPGKWILHHDNAPAHDALRVRAFLAKNSIT
jgi:hypothetical protein